MTRPKRRPRIPRVPVTSVIKDTVGIQMHTALAVLRNAPTRCQYDSLSGIFNMISVARNRDCDDARILDGAIRTMQAVQKKADAEMRFRDDEISSITQGVLAVERMIGKMDMIKMYEAHQSIQSGAL